MAWRPSRRICKLSSRRICKLSSRRGSESSSRGGSASSPRGGSRFRWNRRRSPPLLVAALGFGGTGDGLKLAGWFSIFSLSEDRRLVLGLTLSDLSLSEPPKTLSSLSLVDRGYQLIKKKKLIPIFGNSHSSLVTATLFW